MFQLYRPRMQEPDDAQVQKQIDHWRKLLTDEDALTDEMLDEQLLRLLERMRDSG